MAIRCNRTDCKFNDGGWCTLDYVEIDEEGKCVEYEPDEKKKIIEHNENMLKILQKLSEIEGIPKEEKDQLAFLLLLGLKTEDGELVYDKLMNDLKTETGD